MFNFFDYSKYLNGFHKNIWNESQPDSPAYTIEKSKDGLIVLSLLDDNGNMLAALDMTDDGLTELIADLKKFVIK